MSVFIGSFHGSMLAPPLAVRLGLVHVSVHTTLYPNGEFELVKTLPVNMTHIVFVMDFLSAGSEQINREVLALIMLLRQLARCVPTVTLMMPYLPYGRAENWQDTPLALLFEVLAHFKNFTIMTIDQHNEAIILPHTASHDTSFLWDKAPLSSLQQLNPVLISPDSGGAARVYRLAATLNFDHGIMSKERNDVGDVRVCNLTCDVESRAVILYDDIIDTGKTAVQAADFLRARGAKKIVGFFTHAVLSDGAQERLQQAGFDDIFFTNSLIKLPTPGVTLVLLEDLMADFLRSVFDSEAN